MNFSQADTIGNGLKTRLQGAATIRGIDEALRVGTEAANTREAALLEREIELRKLQETLAQDWQDCQAWEDRLRMLESHLQEREEKMNEREQALEKALTASAVLQPSADKVKDSELDDDIFSLRSMSSMTPSVILSIRSSTVISIADSDMVDFRSTGMSEPSLAYNPLSRRQKHVLGHHTLQWRDLDSRRSLTWSDIPWPTFTELARPEELKQEEVRIYLKLLGEFGYRIFLKWLEPRMPRHEPGMQQSSRGASDFFAKYIGLWHPDRLEVC
jgi:hypothetical protein